MGVRGRRVGVPFLRASSSVQLLFVESKAIKQRRFWASALFEEKNVLNAEEVLLEMYTLTKH